MTIRSGIGGWTYEPWRGGTFFPDRLRRKEELAFASRAVGAIEINGTFYRLQKPETFRKWREEAPEGFVFALKGSRFVTHRRELATAGQSVTKFVEQGIAELGDMLGPICWQLAANKAFDADDLARFLDLLPRETGGIALRHVLEVGHESFDCARFVELMRERDVAVAFVDAEDRPAIADRTAGFAYLRLKGMDADCPTGYSEESLSEWANVCRAWEAGEVPEGLHHAAEPAGSAGRGGDVFAFMINGAKERAPAAAMALAEMLKGCQ